MDAGQLNVEHAIKLVEAGRLQEAHRVCMGILQQNPNNSSSLQILGRIAMHSGNSKVAINCLKQAVNLDPDNAAAWHGLGGAFQLDRQPEPAADAFRRAIAHSPNSPELHTSLANLYRDLGQFDRAFHSYDAALRLDPNAFSANFHLGIALRQSGAPDKAIVAYERALAAEPNHGMTHFYCGIALQELGRLTDADDCYTRAIQCGCNESGVYMNLGNVRQKQGMSESAIEQYRAALQVQPENASVLNNYAIALRSLGKLSEARSALQKSIELAPKVAESRFNLGNVYRDLRDYPAACQAYREALQISPNYFDALCDLTYLMQRMCDWRDIDQLAERIRDVATKKQQPPKQRLVPPLSLIALPIPTSAQQQLQCAKKWSQRITRQIGSGARNVPAVHTKQKLTVGYLSADYGDHPVASLVTDLFELHDRQSFVVNGYSIGEQHHGEVAERIENAFDNFRDEGQRSYQETAEQIQADGVDILVDLMGYTRGCRPEILALQPAPVQVNFLGFPGTTGSDFLQYIVADPYTVPAGERGFYSETVVQLPHCYLPTDSKRPLFDSELTRQECGLPKEGMVFCSFINSYKITAELFAIWMRLLKATDGSVLWLWGANQWVSSNLCSAAQAHGVAPERLVFTTIVPIEQHLARHRLADIFLDTFPYNAHSTASDALRCGLPLLTCSGESFASRVGGSLLTALGLDELVTHSLQDYEQTALKVAGDRVWLEQLRARLHTALQESDVFNSQLYTGSLERAYWQMWHQHLAGTRAPILLSTQK